MSLTALAASTIAELAFNEIIKAGAGEVAKKSVGGVIDLSNRLRTKIQTRFKDNAQAEAALTEVEQKNLASLEKVIEHLDVEMQKDSAFASEIRQMAQQIINYQNQTQTALKQQNNNYGRDQNIINQPQGNIKIGGS
ncbi:hypothetical protein IQ250_29390 [Pseudanabaenaceae cyanobacterium LEGE 13415]|nr:hypothetical protein [Pseudanabaenaceae cyanobacterium LEGE 13415]